MRLSNAPIRVTAGTYILNAGVAKLRSRQGSSNLHELATMAYPVVAGVDEDRFWRMVGTVETVLGSALLVPFVRPRLVGAVLLAYAAWSLGMDARLEYFRLGPSDPRPSHEGLGVAKDVWLAGIAVNLLLERGSFGRRQRGAGS